jgi:FemAB-related protein (PEP-CTERM system-associated)
MNQPAPDLLRPLDGNRPVRVRVAEDADETRWESFVEVCPEATFFHRFGWKRVLERVLRHRTCYLLAEQDGRLVGILPLAEVRSVLFGHSLASLPFCVYGGAASMLPAARSALHRAAAELGEERAVGYLELRNLQRREPGWPRQDLYVTFRKDIFGDEDENLHAIPRKQRAMVRKGIRAGLRSEVEHDTGNFFALYADNVRRHGTPALARRYFDALREEFRSDCEVLTVFDRRRRPVSSVLSFYFRDEVLPYYAGDLEAARELAANDFKYWELMRRAGRRGARVFDYGRSKRGTGSFDFKKNWGFEPIPLHYEYHLVRSAAPPRNNPLNPKFRLFMSLWRHLPIAVANAIGPHIVRNLG